MTAAKNCGLRQNRVSWLPPQAHRRQTPREGLSACILCDARCRGSSALLRLKTIIRPSTLCISSCLSLHKFVQSHLSCSYLVLLAISIPLGQASRVTPFVDHYRKNALVNRPGSHIPRHNVIILERHCSTSHPNFSSKRFLVNAVAL